MGAHPHLNALLSTQVWPKHLHTLHIAAFSKIGTPRRSYSRYNTFSSRPTNDAMQNLREAVPSPEHVFPNLDAVWISCNDGTRLRALLSWSHVKEMSILYHYRDEERTLQAIEVFPMLKNLVHLELEVNCVKRFVEMRDSILAMFRLLPQGMKYIQLVVYFSGDQEAWKTLYQNLQDDIVSRMPHLYVAARSSLFKDLLRLVFQMKEGGK